MSIDERLKTVKARIEEVTIAAGREVGSVKLLAVSKTLGSDVVKTVYDVGHRFIGESYAQELRDKSSELSHLDLEWHFIGRVQTNKAKWIASNAHMVHTITSVRHAEALAKHSLTPLKCLIQVNIGNEESKGGVPPDETLALASALHEINDIEVCGLMCLPPRVSHPEDAAPYFEALADLAKSGRDRGLPLTELSMGMSGDFEVAIRCGATMVRVGSLIFGPRG